MTLEAHYQDDTLPYVIAIEKSTERDKGDPNPHIPVHHRS